MHRYLLTLCLIAALSSPAYAEDKCIASAVPYAAIAGQGAKKHLFFHLYDAALYAERGVYNSQKPFALTLTYRMNFDGHDISDETIRQIKRLGMTDEETLAAWHSQMNDIFPHVKEGDAITGLQLQNGQTLFCMSGHEIGRVKDKYFGNYFFRIWLDKNAEDQELRRKLVGKS